MQTNGVFKCIHCGGHPLDQGEEAYQCGRCGARYACVFGVPLFLKGVRVTPARQGPSREVAVKLCELVNLGLRTDDATAAAMQQILSQDYHLPDQTLAAENNYFLHRVYRGNAVPLPEDFQRPVSTGPTRAPVNQDVRYVLVDHYLPATLPCGRTLTKNVRIRNVGASILSSRGANPVCLSYHWRNRWGKTVVLDGARSFLPIDLPPGRELTLPTLIVTPDRPGAYRLQLSMVHEGVGWLYRDSRTVGVRAVAAAGDGLPGGWTQTDEPPETYEYINDHRLGRDLVFAEVERRAHPGLRILEVGGCCNPIMRGLPYDVYNVDIDVQTLQVGQLSLRDHPARLAFVAADVNDLPFTSHSFDCIVMFSALHHFVKPVAVLRKLRGLLKPDGFLAVMCEPVGYYLDGRPSADFLRELEQGINEQIFTADEYHAMFVKAGLAVTTPVIDRGSLKVMLRAAPDQSSGFRWLKAWQRPGLQPEMVSA